MRNISNCLSGACLGVLLMLISCSSLQHQVTVSPENGEKSITIEASSFDFTPNNIKAYQGDELVIKITNSSNDWHNFTIEDPHGHVMKNVDLPAKDMVEVKVKLAEPGIYDFYCDKPLHASFGMKGQIQVVKK